MQKELNLFWRGDDRAPAVIFEQGFKRKNSLLSVVYNARGEFDQLFGIGVSTDIHAAAVLPANENNSSWLYLINPSSKNMPVNFHANSLRKFKSSLAAVHGEWAKEQVFEDDVSSEVILAAIAIDRSIENDRAVAYPLINQPLSALG